MVGDERTEIGGSRSSSPIIASVTTLTRSAAEQHLRKLLCSIALLVCYLGSLDERSRNRKPSYQRPRLWIVLVAVVFATTNPDQARNKAVSSFNYMYLVRNGLALGDSPIVAACPQLNAYRNCNS
ncbi:hypothetical protein PCH_Pc23g01000 [Penicillium rubens Wisconsin 54-1255]|uniref:Uncharacterized protein n=1 Tax=Penicillium rubens (strain ATCC 28089 / DSM 1075 / NRRL 1951 / Wisconsin 54-1255) TaxID=500485 RepID=B6HWF0_PENRW|nr:hypothetical protein PCH_Pc23g01000 [Penicillium rubens Wisconsin 54-1255]